MSASTSVSNISTPLDRTCMFTRVNSVAYTMFNITNILLLLPLCIFILHHGIREWRKKQTSSSSISHSDVFTYHMVTMELVTVFRCTLTCYAILWKDIVMLTFAGMLFDFTWNAHCCFHVMTCVERYLAVVHPVTYRNLRNERGIRIRNASIGVVWVFVTVGLAPPLQKRFIFDVCFLVLSCVLVSACSLLVLRVLIRPGPGEQGGNGEKVDQSKKRAFYTILAILCVLVLKFTVDIGYSVMIYFQRRGMCQLVSLEFWLTIPSTLVLPVLFLYRHRKRFF